MGLRGSLIAAMITAFVLAGLTRSAAAQTATTSAATGPLLNVEAAGLTYCRLFDPLASNAGLWLVSAELAARHGTYVRCWPGDSFGKDAPRPMPSLGVTNFPNWQPSYISLRRNGDTFLALSSDDGKQWVEHVRWTVKMPAKSFVGFMALSLQNSSNEGVLEGIQVNGKPFVNPQQVELGKPSQPTVVDEKDGRWHFKASAYSGITPGRQYGRFVYVPVEGDFEITARQVPLPDDSSLQCRLLLCRESLEVDAQAAGTGINNAGLRGYVKLKSSPGLCSIGDPTIHQVVLRLDDGSSTGFSMPRTVVRADTWAHLAESANRLADMTLASVPRRLNWNLSPAVPAKPASAEQLKKLQDARNLAMTMVPGKILAASQIVNEVLDESPTCPEAHSAAAFCGAMLSMQDAFGRYAVQGEVLASPVSHLLLAERLAKSDDPRRRLDAAWVMLLCGYPGEAMQRIATLPAELAGSSEVKALKMYITRDYRPYTVSTVMSAPPLEQLAWLYANGASASREALKMVSIPLAKKNRSTAFLPLGGMIDVGTDHVVTSMGPGLALARDAFDLLTCEQIPLETRQRLGNVLARAVGAPADTDIRKLALGITAQVSSEDGLGDAPTRPVAALMELYAAASEKPSGPTVTAQGRLHWQSIPLRDYAAVQRGLMIRTLEKRARFLGNNSLGDPDGSNAYCQQVAQGLGRMPNVADMFQIYGLQQIRDPKAKERLRVLMTTPLATDVSFVCAMQGFLGSTQPPLNGRGSWHWGRMCYGFRTSNNALSWAWVELQADSWSVDAIQTLAALDHSAEYALTYHKAMPYNLVLTGFLAVRSAQHGQLQAAIEFHEEALAMAPGDERLYGSIARIYNSMGQRDKAIQTVKRAVKDCPFSVALSNLMGDAVPWMLAAGQPAEALAMGLKASQSGSATGVGSLAKALAANGRKAEALKLMQALADRYETCITMLVTFLLEQHYPDQQVLDALHSFAGAYPRSVPRMTERIAMSIATAGGSYELLDQALKGPLDSVTDVQKLSARLQWAVMSRQFDKAIGFARELQKLSPKLPSVDASLAWYVAARMAGNADDMAWIRGVAASMLREDHIWTFYVGGKNSLEELAAASDTLARQGCTHWLLGMEAEIAKQPDKALECYRQAVRTRGGGLPWSYSQAWSKALNKQSPATSQPDLLLDSPDDQ